MFTNEFVVVNLNCGIKDVTEDVIDEDVLKDIPYAWKIKDQTLQYNSILIPINLAENDEKSIIGMGEIENHVRLGYEQRTDNILWSLWSTFKKLIGYTFSIDICYTITYDQLGISYTDGSSTGRGDGPAGYSCCRLNEECEDGLLDDYTGKKYNWSEYSGGFKVGTNNIGELTGFKTAITNFNDKKFQLIIADSELVIKTFREWIYKWKTNGFKTSSGNPIKNKEIVLAIQTWLVDERKNGKTIFLKWTRGHDNNAFNEKCDKLAKAAKEAAKKE